MKEPAYKGKEPLPLSVYVSARAGDPQAVERLLRYYDNYMNCLCTRTLYDEDWCCTIKVDIENSKGQYIEKDKQEATKDGSESTKIQHGI